jgi:hypothetical protein
MGSTEQDGGGDELIRHFHAQELMPLAERLAREGRSVFPLAPEPAASTYYRRREKTQMSPSDFEVFGPGSVEDLEKALAELWTREGLPQLAALAPGLARIARSIYLTGERDEEVSPFIYIMF